ncbi:MAG: hypothetical protein PVJ02_15925 [Gemmatimonadota bacterium]
MRSSHRGSGTCAVLLLFLVLAMMLRPDPGSAQRSGREQRVTPGGT